MPLKQQPIAAQTANEHHSLKMDERLIIADALSLLNNTGNVKN